MNHPNVTWAARGTIIDGQTKDFLPAPFYVMSRCAAVVIGYHCAPCRQPLANVGQLVMHLEDALADTGAVHHIAVYCPTHRWYEAPDDAQMRALTGQHDEQSDEQHEAPT